jgi:inhibitor of KinA
MPEYPRVLPVGEAAFTVEFGDTVDETLNRQVHALDAALQAWPVPGIVETVPTYRSLLVIVDPQVSNAGATRAALTDALNALATMDLPEGRLVEIPVHYGGVWGPDLADVAAHCGMTAEAAIGLHMQPIYTVAMLGLPEALATPRLATPRLRVPPGSIGIAGVQTGVYALETPGGWRIIGRTDLALFDPAHAEPFVLHAGDRVRFVPR